MSSTDTQFFDLDFQPGFSRESTKYSEEGKWYDGNRVRFREGKPENIRGYEKFSTDIVGGTARDLISWTDNNTRPYQAIGTNSHLYVIQNETQYDISPITTAVSVSGNFETFTDSTLVKVSVTNHNTSATDRVQFTGVDTLGGSLDINGVTTIVSVSGVNHFYIDAGTTASSASADQGTTGLISFLMNTEETNAIQGLGYGAGVYNAGVSVSGARGWNDAAESSNIIFLPNQWTLDIYGEDLLALRRFDRLYYLETQASTTPQRAVVVTAAPTATTFVVSPNDRHVICYGARPYGEAEGSGVNPMLVRWSDQENFGIADVSAWAPSDLNTAGDTLLTEGSRIIGVQRSRNSINIWTDKAMYTQTFVGPPFIFAFNMAGTNCGLIGPHAAIDYDGISYWMGESNFYMYDGRVRTMPCTIRRYVFDNFNHTQQEKVYAGINSEFKEIIWLYPMNDSNEPNGYVIYNIEENTWVYGKLFADGIVTVFEDKTVYTNTLMVGKTSATANSYVWDNEPSDVYTGDSKPLSSYLESGAFDLDKGKQLMFADKIIPDYEFDPGENIEFYVNVRNYPNGTLTQKGPFTITANTNKVNFRARGRQATVKVSGTNSGMWRWGKVRFALQPDGER